LALKLEKSVNKGRQNFFLKIFKIDFKNANFHADFKSDEKVHKNSQKRYKQKV
jgi:hypothetical protein